MERADIFLTKGETMRTLFIFLLTCAPILGQEVIELKRTEPQTMVHLKTPQGMVVVTNLKDLVKMSDAFSMTTLQFLGNRKVIGDIELTDDQRETLKKLQTRLKDEGKEIHDQFRAKIDAAASDKDKIKLANDYLKQIGKLKKELEAELKKEFLLPHQNDLVLRYRFQRAANDHPGFYKAILMRGFSSEIELTEEQRRKIREISRETDKEIAEARKKIREKARKKIMKLLNEQQTERVRQMLKPIK